MMYHQFVNKGVARSFSVVTFVKEFVELNVYMESFMLHAKNLVKED